MKTTSDESNPPPVEAGAIEKKPRRARRGAATAPPAPAARKLAHDLAPIAAATGAVLPAAERMAPRLDLGMPITALARGLGQHLRGENIFVRAAGGAVVTVDAGTGAVEVMTPIRFPSWAEERVTFVRERASGGAAVMSMGADLAAKLLASDIFRRTLRRLKMVHGVRLPVWCDANKTAVRLAAPGYDEGTESFTLNSVIYDEARDPDEARKWLLEVFAEFPWAHPDGEPSQPLERNRNFAVQVAAMLATFCRPLLAGSLRPVVAVQANQAGSGKTLLLRMALAPVYGAVTVQAAPKDEAELGKLLTATAAEGHTYLVLDNLSGYFASSELDSFITSPRRRGRILGQSQTVDAENLLSVFITGNGLHLSPDLARRCLLCDLWCSTEVSERVLARPIDEEWLASDEVRAGFLSSMWGLLRHWNNLGCPRSKGGRLASFETFSAVIGGIVAAACFADPIARPDVSLDPQSDAWKSVLRKLADGVPDGGGAEFDSDAILEVLEEMGLKEFLIGDAKAEKTALGRRLARWRGRQLHDNAGRLFEFSRRDVSAGARYPIRILTPAAEPAAEESNA